MNSGPGTQLVQRVVNLGRGKLQIPADSQSLDL